MAKKLESGGIAPKRRSPKYKDKVGEDMYSLKTIEQMVEYAQGFPGVNEAKLKVAVEAANSGTNLGLVRMRIGNLVRGALRRAAKQ